MDLVIATVLTGIGATAVVDLWAMLRRRLFGTPPPDYALLGRWLGHMRRGRFCHASIARTAPIAHERGLGWFAHYATGCSFAVLLPLCHGTTWLDSPTVGAAVLIGLVTVAAPWCLMQPAMGAGFAARHAPRPGAARLQGLLTHLIFGLGLYASASAQRLLHLS